MESSYKFELIVHYILLVLSMFLLGFPLLTSVFEIFDLYLLILIASGMGFNVGLIGGVIKMNHFGQMTCLLLLAIRNGN